MATLTLGTGAARFSENLRTLLFLVASILIIAQFAYTTTFNFVPTTIRYLIAGIMFVLHFGMACCVCFFAMKKWVLAVILSVVCILFAWIVAFQGQVIPFDYATAMRSLWPYFAIIWILSWPDLVSPKLVRVLVYITIIVAILVAVLSPPLLYAGTYRAAIFTGGETSVHSAAYAVGACILVFDQLRLSGYIRNEFAWPTMLVATILVYAYEVRTVFVMLAIYVFGNMLIKIKNKAVLNFILLVMALGGIFAIFLYFSLLDVRIELVGNGRFGQYIEKLIIISNRDVFDFIFGSGLSSDFIVSKIWWWAPKVTHNDILHIFIEQGLLGFVSLIIFTIAFYRAIPRQAVPMLAAFYSTSFVSIGFLARPTLVCFVFFAMAILIVRVKKQEALQAQDALRQ